MATAPAQQSTLAKTGNPISPKVAASGLGAAVATIFWGIAAATFWKNTFDAGTLSALTGASSTVLGAVLGYLVPDSRRQVT